MGSISLFIIVANVVVSYRGMNDERFFNRYAFEVERVLINREYIRMISSGFLHLGWLHLVFNMLTLYFYSGGIESFFGPFKFLVVYMSGLIGGNLLSLFIHRHHGDYSSVGASGAVCGVIFANLAIFPGMRIGFFGIPIAIPGWLFGLAFVLYSIYGIRSRKDNVGHEAHLGGALVGMLVAIAFAPLSLENNYEVILLIMLPCIAFIIIIVSRPHLLLIDNLFYKRHHRNFTVDQRYNAERADRQKEIDRILEKIHQRGMSSLTKKEKELLDEYSKKIS